MRYLLLAAATLVPVCIVRADEPAAVGYEEVKAVFRAHCLNCHNQQRKVGGLALDSYGSALEGGASGEVIFGGDLESSRLWALVNHDEEPAMPPDQDRIAADKLDTLRRWILAGAPEQAGAAPLPRKQPATQFEAAPLDDSAPGALPSGVCRQPVVSTQRAAAVSGLACSPRAPLVAVAGQRQVALYHAGSAELLAIVPFPEGQPYVIRFSRDGSLLLVAGGRSAHSGCVTLYDVATGERKVKVGDELDIVLAADVDAHLRYVALGGPHKLVKILAAHTGESLFEMNKHTDWIQALEFSPDGKYLATADRAGGLLVWESDTAREYQVYDGHSQAITGLSWRADSKVFATSSEDGNVRLWDLNNPRQIRNWTAHPGGASWVQFARDGRLVTIGRDRQAKVWNEAGQQQVVFPQLDDIGLRVTISADGQRVMAGDWTGSVRGWMIDATESFTQLPPNPPTLEQRLDVARSEHDELAGQVAQREGARQQTQAELAAFEATYAQAITELVDRQQQARKIKAQLDELQRERELDLVEDDRVARQQVAAQETAWEDACRAAAQAVEPLQVALAAQQRSREELRQRQLAWEQDEARRVEQQARCQGLEAELASFHQQGQKLVDRLESAEQQVVAIRQQLETTRQMLAKIEQPPEAGTAPPIAAADASPTGAEPPPGGGQTADPTGNPAGQDAASTARQVSVQTLTEQIADYEAALGVAEQEALQARESLEFFQSAYGQL